MGVEVAREGSISRINDHLTRHMEAYKYLVPNTARVQRAYAKLCVVYDIGELLRKQKPKQVPARPTWTQGFVMLRDKMFRIDWKIDSSMETFICSPHQCLQE